MKLLKAAQMKEIDQRASQEYMIPSIVLMENAGLRAMDTIIGILNDLTVQSIVILAGRGNNGGDGLVIARHLINAGAHVEVFLLGAAEDLSPDAAINYQILQKMNGNINPLLDTNDLDHLMMKLLTADMIIDAIYGIGFRGSLNPLESQVAKLVNWSQAQVLAIDIPSGVEADSGSVHGEAIKADYTVTFAAPKLGMVMEPGRDYMGNLSVADISIPQSLLEDEKYNIQLVTESMLKHCFGPRRRESHKGSYGHALVMGGSPGMSGAALMASWAALRSGVGLVTAAVPQSLLSIADAAVPEIMSRGLLSTDTGAIALAALPVIEELLETVTVACIGPGMSRYSEGPAVVRSVLEKAAIPLLIDADGLNALEGEAGILKSRHCPTVITPHPGEMSRLTGLSVQDIQHNRLDISRQFAAEWEVTVVLKGNQTVIASPSGQLYINPTGNPGMATAGSGDVLAGIITGLMAQGVNTDEAARVGVYVHGRAGDKAALQIGQRALTATDIIHSLPIVLQELES